MNNLDVILKRGFWFVLQRGKEVAADKTEAFFGNSLNRFLHGITIRVRPKELYLRFNNCRRLDMKENRLDANS